MITIVAVSTYSQRFELWRETLFVETNKPFTFDLLAERTDDYTACAPTILGVTDSIKSVTGAPATCVKIDTLVDAVFAHYSEEHPKLGLTKDEVLQLLQGKPA